MDESGLTWLERPPKIKLVPVTDARKPYPLSWEEQARELPDHLAKMPLFKVNSGCREQEVCGLRWGCEIDVPGGPDVCGRPARTENPEYVFTYCGERQKKINNSGCLI
jgi:hypothetical protein